MYSYPYHFWLEVLFSNTSPRSEIDLALVGVAL